MASLWQWLFRPEATYAKRKTIQKYREILRDYKESGEEGYRGWETKLKQEQGEYSKELKRQAIIGSRPWRAALYGSELTKWYDLLFGGEETAQDAIRKGRGVIGGYGHAIQGSLNSIRINPHPSFHRTMADYATWSRQGLAEVLLHRVSNILGIVRRDLKSDPKFIMMIMQASIKSHIMYKQSSTINPDRRFGEFLLEWAHDNTAKHHLMAKRVLPKPTPKLQKGKSKRWLAQLKAGEIVGWQDRVSRATDRYIRMHFNPTRRVNKAAYWYRGLISGSAEKMIASAVSRGKVDAGSKASIRVKKHWEKAIQQAPREAKAMSLGAMTGRRWNPRIEIAMEGNLPYKLFPAMISVAAQKDKMDMAEYVAKKIERHGR